MARIIQTTLYARVAFGRTRVPAQRNTTRVEPYSYNGVARCAPNAYRGVALSARLALKNCANFRTRCGSLRQFRAESPPCQMHKLILYSVQVKLRSANGFGSPAVLAFLPADPGLKATGGGAPDLLRQVLPWQDVKGVLCLHRPQVLTCAFCY